MSLFTERELKALEQAVTAIEANTDAEIVTVFARQADNYHYIPTLVAAVIALILPWLLLLTPLWLSLPELLMAQVGLFVVLTLLFRFRPLLSRLIPKRARERRCDLLARYQFLEQNLHVTDGNLGLLIFISELERRVQILVDHGIAEKIDNSVWQQDIDDLTARVAAGQAFEGLMECLAAVGSQLSFEFPATGEKNQLCNKLVII